MMLSISDRFRRTVVLLILLVSSSSSSVSGARWSSRTRPIISAWKTRHQPTTTGVTSADDSSTSSDSSSLSSILLLAQQLRGGSTKVQDSSSSATKASTENNNNEIKAYRLQQQLYLQSRSLQLRQALLARGLDGLAHCEQDDQAAKRNQVTDWDCALATAEHPKSCLYSFDAEQGSKVLAPIDTQQYITLSALNRLRRNDPTKVEPLWHSQYSILKTWFAPDHVYSLYNHLNFKGTALSLLLDRPMIMGTTMTVVTVLVFLLTLPFWEGLLTTFLTSSVLWLNWPQWGRFLHAALPLQLLLAQMAWKGLAQVASMAYKQVRQNLIEWECQIWEDCIPLTILEGKYAESATEEEEEDDDDDVIDFEDDESDEE